MSHDFGEEHQLLRGVVRDFVEREIVPYIDGWEDARGIPRDLFLKMGEVGFLGIRIPETYGGSGSDVFGSVILAEGLMRGRAMGLTVSVLVHTDMATPYVTQFGSEAQKKKYLPRAVKGELLSSIAITEPAGGSDVANIQTRALKKGGRWILNGSKMFITNGTIGDLFVVAVRTGTETGHKGLSLILVERGAPGFTVSRKLDKMGWHTSDTAELAFQDTEVPLENLLGKEGEGFYCLMKGLQNERLVTAACCLGAMDVMLEDARDYMRNRKQFGKPISSFQALRHKYADLVTELAACRELTYKAARMMHNNENATREVSMAKLLATELANRVAYDCLQFYGGYGCMKEYPIERLYRDMRIWPIGAGTSEIMREIIAKDLDS